MKVIDTNYRRTYFKYHKGVGGWHQCAYCGKWFPKDKITVDHLLPQNLFNKVKHTSWFISALCLISPATMFYGIALFATTPLLTMYEHSRLNLVASCQPCNSKKSDKINHMLVQGVFLRFKILAIPYYAVTSVFKILTFPLRLFKRKKKKRR